MQKIAYFFLMMAPCLVSANVDPVMREKIKQMTSEVLAQERQKVVAQSRDAQILANVGPRLDNMFLRLSTMENSLAYYSRIKRKLTMDIMDRMTPEVARACCPLNPTALQGQRWYFRNKGNKFKGKGLSGLRDKEKKDKGRKNRKRGRGQSKRDKGGDSAIYLLRPSPHFI